jgi:hypothetical protein
MVLVKHFAAAGMEEGRKTRLKMSRTVSIRKPLGSRGGSELSAVTPAPLRTEAGQSSFLNKMSRAEEGLM